MYLLSLVQKLSVLLQDLFIKLWVKQKALALSLHHWGAEVSETLLQMIPRDLQLKKKTKNIINEYLKFSNLH